ncbi:DUF4331 domain-containing protein [Variovorax sp. JS1663]|uniref:DUF4331 domain-containing protein n=1 Tax=Variovorax sp. JS1663 TaxID=1851577 RepID=UPI000B343546|nr:DUF4331 domain-containing protein [Variovorax sp. JS1663]OUM02990.1 hypothetical protein A8M77_08595 [Variovorax sp. JS1663]
MRHPPALAIACAVTLSAGAVASLPALASSHREAPAITGMPKVDGTDFYMFRSYEPGRQDFVTLIANYQPDQSAYGGPNYFFMDPAALYEIHLDTNGDAQEDISFQFRFKNTLRNIQLPIGGRNVSIPLVQSGAISSPNGATSNLRESFTLTVVRGDRRGGTAAAVTGPGGIREFDKPTDNIGNKTFGGPTGYDAYANQHIYAINVPGCATAGRLFVGQRKDPFTVALGQIFDLINLNPLGTTNGNPDALAAKNITTLALELPIACVATGGSPIVGGWTSASVRQGRLIASPPKSGHGTTALNGGPWAQVSRLGMPLVNEVVIGLKDKDRFNSSKPKDDAQFADYVTNPTLPALIQTLFPSAPAPTNFPRTDLVAAFLTGIDGVNKPANGKAAEMLRLNTSVMPTPRAGQSNLGVLGGDNAGFPNGRRPGDDVVDAELRVAMGALCVATGASDALKVGCKPADAPAGGAPITDGALQSPAQFPDAFPYLNSPLPGAQ